MFERDNAFILNEGRHRKFDILAILSNKKNRYYLLAAAGILVLVIIGIVGLSAVGNKKKPQNGENSGLHNSTDTSNETVTTPTHLTTTPKPTSLSSSPTSTGSSTTTSTILTSESSTLDGTTTTQPTPVIDLDRIFSDNETKLMFSYVDRISSKIFLSKLSLVNGTLVQQEPILIGEIGTRVFDIHIDYINKCIIMVVLSYLDTLQGGIQRICLDSSVVQDLRDDNYGSLIEDMTIDWKTRTVYWTDSKRKTIEYSNVDDPSTRKELPVERIGSEIILDMPRGIAVDPEQNLLFWTDWGEKPHIGRFNLTSNASEIIYEQPLSFFNSIVLDIENQTLLLVDAHNDVISTCGYNGDDMVEIRSRGTKNLLHPYKLASGFQGRFLFWTDWLARGVFGADTSNPDTSSSFVVTDSSRLKLLRTGRFLALTMFDPKNFYKTYSS